MALGRLDELADGVVEQLHACREAVVGVPPVLALRAARAGLGRDHRGADARRELEAAREVLDVLAALALVGVDEVAVAGDAGDRDARLLERAGPLGVVEALLDEVAAELDGRRPKRRQTAITSSQSEVSRAKTPKRGHGGDHSSRGTTVRAKARSRPTSSGGPGGVSSTIQPS